MIKIPLYKEVSLKCDLPKYHLKKGDIATIVEYIEGKDDLPNAYVLEAFDALGETIGIFTLPDDKVASITHNEVLHARTIN